MKFFNKVKGLYRKKIWIIGYRKLNNGKRIFTENKITDLVILKNSIWYAMADPFLIKVNNENYLFFEKQSFFTMKGEIACINLDSEQQKPKIILKCKYHLSYPFIFEYQGDYYMIPESAKNNKMTLYKSNDMPDSWKKVHDICTGEFVDTTLMSFGTEKYLFTTNNDKLLIQRFDMNVLKVANDNTIVINDESNILRSAGCFFNHNSMIYRPSQDCSISYGSSIDVNEVIDVGISQYIEKKKFTIEPNQFNTIRSNIIGVHTYNSNSDYEVVDLRQEVAGLHIFILNAVIKFVQLIYIKNK